MSMLAQGEEMASGTLYMYIIFLYMYIHHISRITLEPRHYVYIVHIHIHVQVPTYYTCTNVHVPSPSHCDADSGTHSGPVGVQVQLRHLSNCAVISSTFAWTNAAVNAVATVPPVG